MTPAEEDALVNKVYMAICNFDGSNIIEPIRDGIRAAYAQGVAQERERAAKCADSEMLGQPFGDWGVGHDSACKIIAAAIRRG